MMQRTLTIHKYTDPKNSYLKVPLGRIRELNLIDSISSSSFLGNGYAFLNTEDYTVFEKALIQSGVLPNLVPHKSSKPSKCTGYKPYHAETVKRMFWVTKV